MLTPMLMSSWAMVTPSARMTTDILHSTMILLDSNFVDDDTHDQARNDIWQAEVRVQQVELWLT